MLLTLLIMGAVAAAVRIARPKAEPAIAIEQTVPLTEGLAPTQLTLKKNAKPDQKELERQANKLIAISAVGVLFAGAGTLLYWPFTLVSIAITSYNSIPLFEQAYRSLVEERRLRASILDSLAIGGSLLGGFYFLGALESLLFRLSRKLLLKTEDNSRRMLANILGELPRSAWILKDGVELEIPIEQLQTNDVVVISHGQIIPIDGVIVDGVATIDQHMLTGEIQPVERGLGEKVFAVTLVLSGRIHVNAQLAGHDTVASNIGRILDQVGDYRDEVVSRGESLADSAAPPILALAGVGLVARGVQGAVAILGGNFIPAARVAIPLSMFNFLSYASKQGILIKDGRAIELLSNVDTIVFDKTGTLTTEQPTLSAIHTCDGFSEELLLGYAAAVEAKQNHPIARAIQQAAIARSLPLPATEDAHYQVGQGLHGKIATHQIQVGSLRFMLNEGVVIPDAFTDIQALANAQANSLVYIAQDGQLAGALELRPTLRPEMIEVVKILRNRGLSLYIISGDHEGPTRQLATELGIERYFAEVLPTEKASLVAQLQNEGHVVCFIGDGINDSIALKKADASISLSGSTTIATDTAQIVMLDGTLRKLPQLFADAKIFNANADITSLITIAFSVVSIGGVFILNFGILSSIILWNMCLLASIGNSISMTSKLKAQFKEKPASLDGPSRE